jgi:PEP-CTERM motif
MRRFASATYLGVVAFVLFAAPRVSAAAVIFDTGLQEPFFGWVGEDINPQQSVGVAFQPTFDCTLDRVGVYFMSNDFEHPGRTYTLKLCTDAGTGPTIPNTGNVLESWNLATAAVGWTPVLDQANSVAHPLLTAGTWYWLVAESTEPPGLDPLWTQAGNSVQYYSAINNNNAGWIGGYSFGSTPATIIEATAVPEPATLGMLAVVSIGALRRRRPIG